MDGYGPAFPEPILGASRLQTLFECDRALTKNIHYDTIVQSICDTVNRESTHEADVSTRYLPMFTVAGRETNSKAFTQVTAHDVESFP